MASSKLGRLSAYLKNALASWSLVTGCHPGDKVHVEHHTRHTCIVFAAIAYDQRCVLPTIAQTQKWGESRLRPLLLNLINLAICSWHYRVNKDETLRKETSLFGASSGKNERRAGVCETA